MKLKPCTECYSPVALEVVHHSVNVKFYLINCPTCGAGPNQAYNKKIDAVQQWNRLQMSSKETSTDCMAPQTASALEVAIA